MIQVDKFLPQIASKSVDNEQWVKYCEKAYAKRYETYQNIHGGQGVWGLTDLTGGIAVQTELAWNAAGTKEFFLWAYEHQHEVFNINLDFLTSFLKGPNDRQHTQQGWTTRGTAESTRAL